uniref:Mitochondrial potassium channel ATP-binding subunit n=1 Tax=Hippocampus comes TaxID=109280 RepID=A0A3Q2XIY6_HIPCM
MKTLSTSLFTSFLVFNICRNFSFTNATHGVRAASCCQTNCCHGPHGNFSFPQRTKIGICNFVFSKKHEVSAHDLPLLGAGALIGSFLRRLSRLAQEQVAKSTGVADEALGNVRTVKAFAMEERECVQIKFFHFHHVSPRLYAYEVEKSCEMNENLGTGIAVFQGLSNIALNSCCLWFALVASTCSLQMVRGTSAGARVFEYLSLKPTIPLSGGGRIPYHSLAGRVDFLNISFSYPTRPGHIILDRFNLTLPPSKTIAIVGESGGGKSTVAALLERFYDPTSGVVMLDGLDIRTLDLCWLRGQVIGFINQEPVLFGASIMENIRFGKPEATDAEVFEAAKQANAHRFITSFPDGYNTVLGERGVTLSGGQKQRVAIARALIKNPSILVLDEATSALDAESERVVQEALDLATRGRTVLIIAHRLSTIQAADLICVMSNGRIIEVSLAECSQHELVKKFSSKKQKNIEHFIEIQIYTNTYIA